MKPAILTILTALAIAGATQAETIQNPLWLRDVAIAPDGSRIAFTYRGDIFTVSPHGGQATRITTMPSYESVPVWSPDGSKIAFATDRFGGQDVMVMDSKGGTPVRLTFNSAAATPMAFTPDGKNVIFSAAIQDAASSSAFPTARLTEVYSVPVEGGRLKQIITTPAEMMQWVSSMPAGSFIYQDRKGMENEWRKHHTSSVTRDIWTYDAATGKHTNLTRHAGEDRNPVMAPDGQTFYFLSERDGGSMNVYAASLADASAPKALTAFTGHPVRFLSAANNGTLAMAWDGEIYTLTPGQQPKKVDIAVTLDADPEQVETRERFSGISGDASVSPDGKQVAFTHRGDIFVKSIDYSSIKQITRTPEGESSPTWSKDGKTLYYTSERDGHRNIYSAKVANPDDPNFSNATLIEETAVFSPADSIERQRPLISPDGKKMLYIQDRSKLMVRDLATGQDTQVTDGSNYPQRDSGFSVSWGPDSRWVVAEIMARQHEPYADIAIIDTTNGEIINLTNSGYFDTTPHWVLDGNAILFQSERYGMRNHASWGSQGDVMLQFLNKDAYDRFTLSEEDFALLKEVEKSQKASAPKADKKDKKGKKGKKDAKADEPAEAKTLKLDREGLEERVVRLTPASADIVDAIITDDGESLYYLAAFEQGYDLWKIALRKDDVELVKKLDSRAAAFQIPADGGGKIYLVGADLQQLNPDTDRLKKISVSGTHTFSPAKERRYMLDFVETEEAERFYVKDMHGVDWHPLVDHYRRFLPHIDNNYDYSEMLSELLGELNVSHTGSGYFASGAKEPTASLGLIFRWNIDGPGLTVDEIVKGGPFDRSTTALKPGDVITAINSEVLSEDADWAKALNNLAGKKTLVTFTDPRTGKESRETILPISQGRMNTLLYNRWVDQRRHLVDSLSNGRLGYVHIKSMDDKSFRQVYADALGRYNNREGIVIDTRWNGGGRLHEDIEVLFSGHKYMTQEVRGVETCDMPSRRWNKPSIMVVCEANYSNAHGTPFVYQTQKLGKVVGAPVPGTMTSVNWQDLQDDSLYFGIPVIGYRLPDGGFLENRQLEPDILILNDPAETAQGRDAQLETAVATLLQSL